MSVRLWSFFHGGSIIQQTLKNLSRDHLVSILTEEITIKFTTDFKSRLFETSLAQKSSGELSQGLDLRLCLNL